MTTMTPALFRSASAKAVVMMHLSTLFRKNERAGLADPMNSDSSLTSASEVLHTYSMMKDHVTLALAGIRGYGQQFYLRELLEKNPGSARLIAAIDPSPEGAERLGELENMGVPLFASLDEMYKSLRPDLLILSSPIHFHAPQTCRALEQGSNVLCEKPLCAAVEEAKAMAAAEEANDGFVAIGYQWSFSDAVQELKRRIMAGDFGRPTKLKTFVSWPRKKSYYDRNSWAGQLTTPDGTWVMDSPANNATAHYLHNMFYILGATRETSAAPVEVHAELYKAHDITNFDTAAIHCRTDNDAEILFYTTHATPSLIGPIAHYEFENADVTYEFTGEFIVKMHDGTEFSLGSPDDNAANKIWNCVDAINGGDAPACGIDAAASHTRCVNAAQHSMPEVVEFPKNLVNVDEEEGDSQTWVTGLQASLQDCYNKGVLPFAAGGITWARPGEPIDLRHLP